MSKICTSTYTGQCPYLAKLHSITINYGELNTVSRDAKTYYRYPIRNLDLCDNSPKS